MNRIGIAFVLALAVAGLPVSGIVCVTLCPDLSADVSAGARSAEVEAPGSDSGAEVDAHCHSAAPSNEAQFRGAPAAACFALFDAVSARADALRATRADIGVVMLDAAAVGFATLVTPRTDRSRIDATSPPVPLSPPRARRVLRI